MHRQLTEAMLEKLRPPTTGRLEIFDTIVPSMAVRVTPNGAKSFVVRCRIKGRSDPIRVTLGNAPGMKLSQARHEASDVLRQCRAGDDPRQTRRARAEEALRDHKNTFAAVAERFIQEHLAKLRSGAHAEAAIRRYLILPWGRRPIASITMDDVAERVRELGDTPHTAHLVLAYAKRLFTWAAAPGRSRDMRLRVNPCLGLSPKRDFGLLTTPRQVVLSSDHLRLIWKAAGTLGEPFGQFFKMLLLSGQRRSEVAGMAWGELDLDRERVWIIPAVRMKAARPHEVPLSADMVELLEGLQEHRGQGDYVFSTTLGQRPISGFSKAKAALNEAVTELRSQEADPGELPEWRIHDLRRTVRTGLGAIPNIPHDIRELVIGHVPPTLVQTYDLHGYRDEKRQALELWAQRLRGIVEPAPAEGKVVSLMARAAQ